MLHTTLRIQHNSVQHYSTPTPHSAKMPVKRSRAGRSSAYLDAAPVKLTKSDASADAARPKLLDVASPVNTAECAADRKKIGGFLERCYYCNKRIAQNSDVFMYSNLCAFCSVECRDCQINLDKLAGKKPQH